MTSEFYHINGMHCISCAQTIEDIILQQKVVESVKVYFPLNLLILEHKGVLSNDAYTSLRQHLQSKGYNITKISINEIMQQPNRLLINTITRICFVFLIGVFLHVWPMIVLQYKIIYPMLAILLVLSFRYVVYMKNEIVSRRLGMGSFLSVALILTALSFLLSLFQRQYNTSMHIVSSYAMILFFVELGKSIGEFIRLKSFKQFLQSFTILDKKVIVKNGGNLIEKNVGSVEKNDVVIVKAGENVYFDGVIVKGSSNLNEAIVTGESEPVFKKEGASVFSGSQNISGALEIKVSNNFFTSTLGIIQLYILKKLSEKTDTQITMDKFLRYFIIIELVLVAGALIYHYHSGLLVAIEKASTIALLSCPCAFGIATPLVLGMAYMMAYKRNLLLTNPNMLEMFRDAKYIIIDKTGTITNSSIVVRNYKFLDNTRHLLNILYTLTKFSNHPKSIAIVNFLERTYKNLEPIENINYETVLSKGFIAIEGDIDYYLGSFSLLIDNFNGINGLDKGMDDYDLYFFTKDKLLAVFNLREEISQSIIESINNLKKSFKDIIMLSGDKYSKVKECSDRLGIETFYAEKTAVEKLAVIRKYKEMGKTVYVGDGLNDVLSLEEADIGISIGRAQDLAKSSADVVLLDNNLNNILSLKKLSRITVWAIKSNILWAIIYNVIFIPLGFGVFHSIHISPVMASILMSCSSLLLTINSFLFLKFAK